MPVRTKSFQELYRDIFARLGHPIKERDGVSEGQIVTAEKKMGIQLPVALRDYYLVAGRERKLNTAFNRLLAPDELELHSRKVVFMEENQAVVAWATTVSPSSTDPSVFQGPVVDGELDHWFRESNTCSGFLVFMLHLQAAYGGGMPYCASTSVAPKFAKSLDKSWNFAGDVNGMRAYSRNGQAICITKWKDFFSKGETFRISAGACSKKELDSLASSLGVEWEK